jgi:hypothetical protein
MDRDQLIRELEWAIAKMDEMEGGGGEEREKNLAALTPSRPIIYDN